MKPNKNNINAFNEWSENLCNKRHDKSVELRKLKAGNNPFKKWFYLGKKVKSTVYKVNAYIVNTDKISTVTTFIRKQDAENFVKNFNTIGYTNPSIETMKTKVYSVERYYNTPYDKLRWKAIKRWHKKVEKYGIEIKRPYFYYGKEKYYIYNSQLEYQNHYRKFCSSWWKEKFAGIMNIPRYHYKTCWYDYFDLFTSLIVKLTIKGLYIGLHGNSVTHKEQMHEIWECRKELIKAYNFEDWYDYTHVQPKIKEKYGIDYELCSYNRQTYLETGLIKCDNKTLNLGISPKIVSDYLKTKLSSFTREDVVNKCDEIDNFVSDLKYSKDANYKMNETGKKILHKAFLLLADNITGWWD